jgi:glyoxylase I family protein
MLTLSSKKNNKKMIKIDGLHHIAIICRDYERSKRFYTDILGFKIVKETYRQERQSFKLDLSMNNNYLIELFSFPNPPARLTRPEGTGLRHIAFAVDNIEECIEILTRNNIETEPVRTDEFTYKKFTFLNDPDNLPIELYEK